MKTEEWRDVLGYEGRYQVSNFGRVKSLPNSRRSSELILKQSKHAKSNHRVVNLTSRKEGGWKQRVHWVHRLVLEAFVGPCPEEMEACHNNGDPTNNCISNLRWDTHESNIEDVRKHETLLGENNGRAILTTEQVRKIKVLIASGESDEVISFHYGVTSHCIKNIRNEYTWSHV